MANAKSADVRPAIANDPDPTETAEWLESLDYVLEIQGPRARPAAPHGARRDGPSATASSCRSRPPRRTSTPFRPTSSRATPATASWSAASRALSAGTPWRWSRAPIVTPRRPAGTSPPSLPRPRCMRWLLNHFIRGRGETAYGGDQVYYQGHAAPGMYARAFLEGRLTEQNLVNFRRELSPGGGLSSYPHPWLMPEFWEFPTVSMGLAPIMAIYQARFNRYLTDRKIVDCSKKRVWAFLGRRRMRRAGDPRRHHPRLARATRQPHVRHQLQPPAARRPGARQRQDHPGA